MLSPARRMLDQERLGRGFHLMVIGGGITGCGIALDAAQRGLDVVLIEKNDIASGTSSRSSKLIHGGLRYLKQMQFRTTALSCRERDRLLSTNPHLAWPVPFLYTARKEDKVPGWAVDVGLGIYDLLAGSKKHHDHLPASKASKLAPGLDVDSLDRTLLYQDGMADDARLTLAVASTASAYGATVLTWTEVLEPLNFGSGRIQGAIVRDRISGRSFDIKAMVVVNAAGVWVDELRDRFRLSGRRVRPSRGTHVVFDRTRLPLEAAVALTSPRDGRPVFLIPHPEGTLVGTTDVLHKGGLDDPRPSQEEVDYILEALQRGFPSLKMSKKDIKAAFAGLRPLLDFKGDDPSKAARDEEVWEEQGMISISGGKLTTFRAMAEEAVDKVLKELPEGERVKARSCTTKGMILDGLTTGPGSSALVKAYSIDPVVSDAMARRLGAYSFWAARMAINKKELQPLAQGLDLCAAEVRAHLCCKGVVRLEDLFIRRARLALWNPDACMEAAELVRGLFMEELEWDGARWEKEMEQLEQALAGWMYTGNKKEEKKRDEVS
ncbi:MAG: glycerol-3-phosphate dehydrogenase/oxidase [Deltaproteobacteria bacterium]|nr:glycerol-3-phosphate dehydrogenase/oxidase [Deltaproteobacteria bacterium]